MQNSPTGPMIKQVSQNAQIKIIFVLLWTGNRVLANFLTVQPSPALEFVFFLAHMRSSFGFSLFSPAHSGWKQGERCAEEREDAHRFSMHIEREREATYSPLFAGAARACLLCKLRCLLHVVLKWLQICAVSNVIWIIVQNKLIHWGCLQTIDLILKILLSENRTPKKSYNK